jgi:hypothetical protein
MYTVTKSETYDPETLKVTPHYQSVQESFDADGFTFADKTTNPAPSAKSGRGIEFLEYDVVWTALGDPDDREWNENEFGKKGVLPPTGIVDAELVFADASMSKGEFDARLAAVRGDSKKFEAILSASRYQAILDGAERLVRASSSSRI